MSQEHKDYYPPTAPTIEDEGERRREDLQRRANMFMLGKGLADVINFISFNGFTVFAASAIIALSPIGFTLLGGAVMFEAAKTFGIYSAYALGALIGSVIAKNVCEYQADESRSRMYQLQQNNRRLRA